MRKKDLETSVVYFLNSLGIPCRQMFSGGSDVISSKAHKASGRTLSSSPVSYVLGSVDGVFLAVCLSESPSFNPEESRFLRRVGETGGIAFYATSVDDVAIELSKRWPESLLGYQ